MAHIAERLCTHYIPMHLGWSGHVPRRSGAVAALLPRGAPAVLLLAAAAVGEAARRAIALGDDPDSASARGAGPRRGPRRRHRRGAVPARGGRVLARLGLPLYEVYGMSETTGVATVNAPGRHAVGTVGRPLPGVEVALSEDGEVLMRGPVIMRGYRNRPEATAEALDADGWLHSGDIGAIDDDGYLRIVDRIKELIISAAGKNMSPANIEATIKSAGSVIGSRVRDRRRAALQRRAGHARSRGRRRRSTTRRPRSRRRSTAPTSGWRASSRSSGSPCSTATGCRTATS